MLKKDIQQYIVYNFSQIIINQFEAFLPVSLRILRAVAVLAVAVSFICRKKILAHCVKKANGNAF